MHYLVKLLVEADNAKEAMAMAEDEAQNLVDRGEFDWYNFDGRWGKSKAYGAKSQKGKKLIEEGMEAARREFDEGLAAVRYMLDNFTDEQIFEEDFPTYDELNGKLPQNVYHLSRCQFSRVSGHTNAPVIYSDGDIVDSKRSLKAQFEYAKQKLWVVPVDFHN